MKAPGSKKAFRTGEFAEREKMLWFWLVYSCGLRAEELHRVFECLPDPEEITQMTPERITETCRITPDRACSITDSVKDLEWTKEICARMTEQGIRMLTFYDEAFPDRLRLIPDPPFLLFVKGKLPETSEPAVAVVGSRNCTDYGKIHTEQIARELARSGCHIISGLAYGIDACAHRGALAGEGKTTAVMGCGIDQCYPSGNYPLYRKLLEKEGAVISEFPPGARALAWHFPVRNRIISGLADCVLVMEAKEKSGSQITVSYALDQGRDVFALPGRLGDPQSSGCNAMIRDGAQILLGANQVLEVLSLQGFLLRSCPEAGEDSPNIALDNEEKQVYSALSNDPVTLDELLEKTQMAPGTLHRVLVSLELEELLLRTDQGKYYRKRQIRMR